MAINDQIIPLAVSLLVLRQDDKILAISRKDSLNDFGLPGGKVESGESAEQAIRRETQEETGMKLGHIVPVFTRICRGKIDYLNTTFVPIGILDEPRQIKGEGRLAWIPPKLLCCGSFGEYNAQMLKVMMITRNTRSEILDFDPLSQLLENIEIIN